ncbi:HIT family protein [Candidatus Pacearchaeota archaeon]|nr:HIT family protein [Candidatus Pacearchaeota archaeon]
MTNEKPIKIKECWMCRGSDNQLIKEYNFWKLLIHPNQYYLGRCMIVLKRHIEDITEINDNERNELFNIMKNLRKVIGELFEANLFNYASLGNITRHAHVHFIPRYNHEVEFEGKNLKMKIGIKTMHLIQRTLKFLKISLKKLNK